MKTRFQASTRRGLTTFVNRAPELAQMTRAMDEVQNGATRIVCLLGGPGMGKTRLLEEFLHAYTGSARVVRGYCEDFGDVAPLQPFIQMLRQLLEIDADTPVERALSIVEQSCRERSELLPHQATLMYLLSLGPRVGSAPQQSMVIALLLLTKAVAKPLVLAIDDWQWVDDLSHEVLRGVIAGASAHGLLVLLTARQVDRNDVVLARPEAGILEVLPLHQDDAARIVHSLVPGALDLGLARAIHNRSGGNPLFVEELCRALPGDTKKGQRAFAQDQVPQTVHGVIQARLLRLPEKELELLQIASVIGHQFSSAMIASLLAQADLASTLQCLSTSDLVRSLERSDDYRFKHGIARDVVYESVRLSRRRELHAAVARALEATSAETRLAEPHEALAYHYVGSGDHERAVHHAEQAGHRAAQSSSLDRARLQYGTAMAELDQLPQSPEVQLRWLLISMRWARATVYNQAWEHIAVLERAARYAEELGDSNSLADVEHMCAWICYALGDQQRASTHCRRGLLLAEQNGNQKLVGQLLSNLGQSHAAAGEYPEAIDHIDRALRLKRDGAGKREQAVPVGFAYALGVRAAVHADQGDFALAHTEMAEALYAVRGAGHAIEASLLALRAMMELWQGLWERCIATCAQACETAERVHGAYVFAISQSMRSYARLMLDRRTPEQLASLQSAVAWLESRDMGLYLSMNYACAAEACLLLGELSAAREYAARGLERAQRKDPFGEGAAHRVLATLFMREELYAEAEAALDAASQSAEARGTKREQALTDLLRAALQRKQGDVAAAALTLQKARAAFETMGMPYHQQQAEQAVANPPG